MKIGFQELVIIFIVALVVIGPDKLPYYAQKLGQALGQFKKYTSEATKDFRENVVEPLQEAQRPLREAMEPLNEMNREMQNSIRDIKSSVSGTGKQGKQTEEPADSETADPETVDPETDSSEE